MKFSLNGFCSELQANFDKVMQQYKRICFANYVEEVFQVGGISQRQYSLLSLMMKFGLQVDEGMLLKRTDVLAKSIYASVKSERTIRRDIDSLKSKNLLISEGKLLSINYDVMKAFIGINPDVLFQKN